MALDQKGVNELAKNIDENKHMAMLILDFSKECDTMTHKWQMIKLEHYRMR